LFFGDYLKRILNKQAFNKRISYYISVGEYLDMKRNSDGVSSDDYKAETNELIDKVKKTLHKYKRESEVVRVVKGLEFKFDDLDSIGDSRKEQYRRSKIANVIQSLVANLSELQERERKG